jgi:excisionase family DNA binding protein
MLDDLPPFLTVGQAAEVLQLGRSKVYELTMEYDRSGGKFGLPFVWFGCQKRIPRANASTARCPPARLQRQRTARSAR